MIVKTAQGRRAHWELKIVNVRIGPYVSSADYYPSPEPLGGVGVAGRFEIEADASADHYVLTYEDQGERRVARDAGGFTLTPTRPGPNVIAVCAMYRDGSRSLPTIYTFDVA